MVRRPYLGEILERASPKQRANSFSCDKIGFIQRLPQKWEVSPVWLREQYMEKYWEYRTYEKNQERFGFGFIRRKERSPQCGYEVVKFCSYW